VRAWRQRRGLGQAILAARIGLSRQALAAIEGGRSVPSTAVALRLARALGTSVEVLFQEDLGRVHPVQPVVPGTRVALAQVGARWVAARVDAPGEVADGLGSADGVEPFRPLEELEGNVLIAGCAPVLGALAAHVTRPRGGRLVWLRQGSGEAVRSLAEGRVHIAGLHLADRQTPTAHDALLRRALPDADLVVVSLVCWREGLAVAPGNPLGIRGPEDLARTELRFARRAPDAGAGVVLARALRAVGRDPTLVPGLDAAGHAEAGQALRLGAADVAVLIEPVAEALGLPFFPLCEERFELAMRREDLAHPGVSRVLDGLVASPYAREVAGMGAYDVGLLGEQRRVAAS